MELKEPSKKSKEVKRAQEELLDSEEESVDPSNSSKYGGNPCYSHSGNIYYISLYIWYV